MLDDGLISSVGPLDSVIEKARSSGLYYDGNEHLSLAHRKIRKDNEEGGDPVLEVKDVGFAYPGEGYLLENINLRIRKGDVVTLVGDNGSGKTTLLKMIAGMLQPTRGSITVLGKKMKSLSVAEATENTGFLMQNPDHQIFHDTISKELRWGLRLKKTEGVDAKTRYWLDRLHLSKIAEEHPYSHSKLIRQKVALASILAPEPALLLLDEPSHGMDHGETRNLIHLIHELSGEENMAILLVTHNHSLAASCGTRVLALKGGSFQ